MIPLFPFKNIVNQSMNNAMANSPQYQRVMEYINANGGDPKAAFYKLANEMGVDPEEGLSMLRNK